MKSKSSPSTPASRIRSFVHLAIFVVVVAACNATPHGSGPSLGSTSSALNGPDETWAWRAVTFSNEPFFTNMPTAWDPTTSYVVAGNTVNDCNDVSGYTNLSTWTGGSWVPMTHQFPYGVAIAYDSTRKVLVAVGSDVPGYCGGEGGNNPDTFASYFWSSDGTTLAASAQPPARAFTAMTYDSTRKRIVLFGGESEDDLADTWEWDGTTWANKTPASPTSTNNPPAGLLYPMTFDSGRSRTVMLAPSASQTEFAPWEWDGTTWTNMSPATGSTPPWASVASIVYDAVHANSVVYTDPQNVYPRMHSTWTWNGTSWTNVIAATQDGGVNAIPRAYDGGGQHVVDFEVTVGSDGELSSFVPWTGSGWDIPTTSLGYPSLYDYVPLYYDTARNKVSGAGSLSDWVSDGTEASTAWTCTLRPAASPGPQFVSGVGRLGITYDAHRQRAVVFSSDSTLNTEDIWEFDGTTWSNVTVTSGTRPIAAEAAAFFDPVRNRAGMVIPGASVEEIWEWDGTSWSNMTPANTGPSLRGINNLAFDATMGRSELVIFGGSLITNYGSATDTWLWNGTTWTNAMPAHAPGGVGAAYGSMVYIPELSGIVLPGSPGSPSGSTYLWNGTDWTKSAGTQPLYSDNVVYDAANHQANALETIYGRHGGACTGATDSTTGNCVDGVSCDTASCGTCQACDLSGSAGTCATVTSADDPDTCGATFNGSTCNASGACRALPGTAATSIAACLSSPYITDGVCCSVASCGFCLTCNGTHKQSGANDGNCAPQAAGNDDKNDCEGQVAATCGQTGACDGTGMCQLYAAGTSCGATTCNGNTAVGPTCDGSGICSGTAAGSDSGTATGTDCSPYTCTPVFGCSASCTSDAQCIDGYYCASGSCAAKLAAGVAATSGTQCSSGYAVDGVCCLAPSCGACQTCNGADKATPADDGLCADEKAGSDVKNDCATTAASSCQTTGLCDGKGVCALYAAGTSCGASTCVDNRATGQVCNGTGTGACVASATGVDCTPYLCASSGCQTSCAKDADCVTGYACTSGTCNPLSATSCDGDHTITAPNGTKTDCGAYKCNGTTCRSSCSSVEDCTSPNVCDANQHCVAPSSMGGSSSTSGCSCHVIRGGGSSGGPSVALLAAVLTIASRRRRKRA